MQSGNYWDQDGPYIERAIHFKAKGLVDSLKLPTDELDDIKQELRIDLLQRLPRFDPKKASRKTFISRLLRNKTTSLREKYTAAKRDVRKSSYSLDATIDGDDEDLPNHLEILSSDEYNRVVYHRVLPNEQRLELAMDIRIILPQLTIEQQQICHFFADGQTPTLIAKTLELSRPALYDRIKILKKRFEDFGYKSTPSSPDTSTPFPVNN